MSLRRPLPALLTLLVAAALLLAGCGDDEDGPVLGEGETTTPPATAATTTEEAGEGGEPRETVDELPKLPRDWDELINRQAGFAIGVPPLWETRTTKRGQGSVLTSPDELVVISVTADRTQGALSLPLEDFATRTAEALGSDIVGSARFRNLTVGPPAPFQHTYDAVAVRASGTPRGSGVPEKVLVVIVRRAGLASYVVFVRENAERDSEFADRDLVKRIIRSLRGRPPA